jgi:hypothetical protein
MNVRLMTSAELEALPVYVGFYAVEHVFTSEQAAAREAERQAGKRQREQ